MGTHYIGTSGFSYKDWVGPFYPEGLQKSEFLSYYARRFSFTELNFTYYRMPGAATLERMASKVPEGFRFTVKAPGSLTHQREAGWREDCTQYRKALEPLQDTGALAGILMQFPYSYHYTPENRSYLDALTEEIGDLPLFVEFRNDEWDRESVLEGLHNRSVGVVVTDHPALPRLPGLKRAVTGQQAYFRFHGRNKANWWTGDSTSRYDYLYSKEELEERLPDVLRMKQQSRQLYIAFNNHHKGQAAQNAFEFAEMLEANETAAKIGPDKDSTT
jgi:uncharacterized protein YecE (DUF72 family)